MKLVCGLRVSKLIHAFRTGRATSAGRTQGPGMEWICRDHPRVCVASSPAVCIGVCCCLVSSSCPRCHFWNAPSPAAAAPQRFRVVQSVPPPGPLPAHYQCPCQPCCSQAFPKRLWFSWAPLLSCMDRLPGAALEGPACEPG